jgi:hypothetical protein
MDDKINNKMGSKNFLKTLYTVVMNFISAVVNFFRKMKFKITGHKYKLFDKDSNVKRDDEDSLKEMVENEFGNFDSTKRSDRMEMKKLYYTNDERKLIDDTLKYIDILIKDRDQNDKINSVVIPESEPEKSQDEENLQRYIEEKNTKLAEVLKKHGFDNYGDFVIRANENIRRLGIKTEAENGILYHEFEKIKDRLQSIKENNYRHPEGFQNILRDSRGEAFYTGL